MRLVIDAMGAPDSSGGMNLYARELMQSWSEAFPDDELIIVAGEWAQSLQLRSTKTRVVRIARGDVGSRLWTQAIVSGVIARRADADALLSLSPIASFAFPRSRTFAVVHDWRHKLRPSEFSWAQRGYRRLWELSLARVQRPFAISTKTAHETTMYARRSDTIIVENGGDHPRRWAPIAPVSGGGLRLLTYGHFNNKRPEGVIDAIAELRARGFEASLTIIGARGEYREALRSRANDLNLGANITLPGWVDDTAYHTLVQQTSVLVLNSSDEGFGLPVLEASYFGIPVVAATDSGLGEIHGDRVILSQPDGPSIAAAVAAANASARHQTPAQTWRKTATQVRNAIIAECSHLPPSARTVRLAFRDSPSSE